MSNLAGPITVNYPPAAPPGTVEKRIIADTPLVVNNANSPHNTEYVITNGKTLRIQSIRVGSSKDPSEKGARVEVIYHNGTEHLFDRFFTADTTLQPHFYPDRSTTRDGTAMVGNGSHKLIVRRTRLSSPDQEIDVVVEAYEEVTP